MSDLIPENELAEVRKMATAMSMHPDEQVRVGASATLRFVKHVAALEERVATEQQIARLERQPLEQHISELEKSLENARKERDEAYQKGREDERAFSKPSGQVAEDVAAAASLLSGAIDGVGDGPRYDRLAAAISLLSTKSQGHEGLLAVCAAVSKSVSFTGPVERLADAVESAMEVSRKTLAEYQHAERDRKAAVADNAALLDFLRRHAGCMATLTPCGWCEMNPLNGAQHAADCELATILAASHPGAALLERMKRLEEQSQRSHQEGRDAGLESIAVWAENRPRGCKDRNCKACTEASVIAGMARAMKGGKTPEEAMADLH